MNSDEDTSSCNQSMLGGLHGLDLHRERFKWTFNMKGGRKYQ